MDGLDMTAVECAKTDHRSGMESDSGRGYSNPWVRFGDS